MRKRPKRSPKKYFWRDMYIGTIPTTDAALKQAHALAGVTNLQMLDQTSMTQETFINALFMWAAKLARERGARGLEEELRQPFADLSELVAADLKEQERIKLEHQDQPKPEGFTDPSSSPAPKRSRRRDEKNTE